MRNAARLFYVYEHWRPDLDVCFYVGKGKGRRAYTKQGRAQNKRYARITAKLARLGMCVEVRMVAEALSEAEAFQIERERIAFWRASGDELANMTDGGEGVSGLKMSPFVLAKIKEANTGRKHSAAEIAKRSSSLKGHRTSQKSLAALRLNDGKPLSAEHRAKLSAAKLGKHLSQEHRAALSNAGIGKKRGPMSADHRLKISESKKGGKASVETRAKMSETRRGCLVGPCSEDRRKKISATLSGRPWSEARRRAYLEKQEL